jgi:hypothetical protein
MAGASEGAGSYTGGSNVPRDYPTSRLNLLTAAGAVLLISLGIARLVPTYAVSSQNFDEPYHIASGMEWLDKGAYTYGIEQPPLARVVEALGLYIAGVRCRPVQLGRPEANPILVGLNEEILAWAEGNAILYSDGNYWRNLTLARLGALPFFVLACVGIVLWARRWFTTGTAMWALLLFISLPPVLAVAGQATTDMACAATVFIALYQFLRWMDHPDAYRSAILGAALSLALLSKYSCIPFLGACFAVALVYFALSKRTEWRKIHWRWRPLCVIAGVAFVLIWAGYRFSFHRIATEHGYDKTLASISASRPRLGRAFEAMSQIPLPMPELPHGLYMVLHHNQAGHESYLFGRYRNRGWWYFFPVMVAIKTPIGFLLLSLLGAAAIVWRMDQSPWRRLTVLFPVALMLVCMTAQLNLGVRHILPIYPLMAVLAGHAISISFRGRAKWVLGPIVVLLAGSVVVDSWIIHPDYMSYFNQLAGSHPSRITVESDMGQDVHRLSQALRSLGAKEVAIRINTTAELEKEGLPPFCEIPRYRKISGFVAISDWFFEISYAQNKSYGWLRAYTPIQRVGKTISLYRIPE